MAIKKKSKLREAKKNQDLSKDLNVLPNTFKFAAEALKLMSERGGSAGSIVVNKYKSYNYRLIYALVMNTIKNIKIIKKIIHEVKLAKKVQENDPFLLEILVGDLLYGKGLKSVEQNSTAAAIIAQKDAITKQQKLLKQEYSKKGSDVVAKYLRVNTLKSNMSQVLSQLKTVGLKQVEYSKDKIKFKKFINKFKSINSDEFLLDFHFPNNLIILKPEAVEKIKKTDLLKKGKALLQDKASFMAIEAMDLKPGDKIIDACCAPGCKTSLIGNKLTNKGKILAYDIDKKRLLSAIHLLKVHGVTCAKLEVGDFTKVKLKRLLKSQNIDQLDSIIIDPSCSGSGISSRVDYKATQTEAGRLKKLQAFQVAMLKHAIKACVSKSIVYCTCSTSTEENESAIKMALSESGVGSCWDVVEIIPFWPQRGDSAWEFGSKCIRSDENNLTNGFFIAKLQRNSEPTVQSDQLPELIHEDDLKTNGNHIGTKKMSQDVSNDDENLSEEPGEDEEKEVEDEEDSEMSEEEASGEEEELDEEEEEEEEEE